MNTMTITLAKYVKNGPTSTTHSGIEAVVDGQEMFVPLAAGNRHYEAIMAAVEAGELTIQEAD